MSESARRKPEDAYAGNMAVTAGGLLILVCFALPWVRQGNVSALDMSFRSDAALSALRTLGLEREDEEFLAGEEDEIEPPRRLASLRPLYMIPVLALLCIMLEWTVPPGTHGRALARFSLLAAGAALSTFFVIAGLAFGSGLAYGFWGAMHGALFIAVGAAFNVYRRE